MLFNSHAPTLNHPSIDPFPRLRSIVSSFRPDLCLCWLTNRQVPWIHPSLIEGRIVVVFGRASKAVHHARQCNAIISCSYFVLDCQTCSTLAEEKDFYFFHKKKKGKKEKRNGRFVVIVEGSISCITQRLRPMRVHIQVRKAKGSSSSLQGPTLCKRQEKWYHALIIQWGMQ